MREVPAYRTDDYLPLSAMGGSQSALEAAQNKIMDSTEIQEYTYRTRKEYEEKVRMQKHHIGAWIKYAEWEANLGEFARARSVFERGIDVDF